MGRRAVTKETRTKPSSWLTKNVRLVGDPVIDPDNLRTSLLLLVLRVSAFLGVLVYVPSVYALWKQGAFAIVAVDTIALATVFGLLVFDRIPFRWRAGVVCFLYYALGVGLLIAVGSVSQIYLLGFSIVTVLLLGVRVGLAAAALSSASLLAVGALDLAAPDMALRIGDRDFAHWALIALNFGLINTLVTLAVGIVLAAVSKALKRETASRISLERESANRKQAEAERDRSLAQLQLQIERMPVGYLLSDKDFRYTRWNPAAESIFGFEAAEVLGKHPFEVIVPPEARELVSSVFERIQRGTMDEHSQAQNRTKDGTLITCEWLSTPLFDDDGTFAGMLALVQDVTDRKKLEEQLRQSQKMEAIGQLAGGVAHDFNNLLSVVLSYADLILADLESDDVIRGDVEEIRRAGERAAALTRQLLMFSRQQVIEPKVLDLNDVLSGVDKMLRRLVGEDVELTTIHGPSLGHIRADPGSVEQVLMNLVVNARDAMPVGGKLTIETANFLLDEEYARAHIDAKPGAYVMLAITDTGSGMDKSTLARIFEPFYTTKEKGKGTGLGLSTVFGIVQQSGGTVWVYSELGVGTTFKVYLPRVDEAAEDMRSLVVSATLRGSETILLVEDEDQVRDVARGILLRQGYSVLDARNAGEALLLCEQHPGRIHLLLSDVVMPRMSGPALAKRLVRSRPDMKVLCMSGYTDDAAVRHGVIDAELAYLQKPLTVDSLSRKVRSVLDAR